MKQVRILLSVVLVICMLLSTFPVFAFEAGPALEEPVRAVNSTIIIDDNASGGYEGDYVVIYNPSTSSSTSYSTGTMTGLIETSVGTSSYAQTRQPANSDRPYKIDVDSRLAEYAKTAEIEPAPEGTRASYNVGSTKTFSLINAQTNASYSLQFKCLYVGQHCYIWTPTSTTGSYYPLDQIDSSFAQMAANEFDSKFDLMQSSFGNHTNGSSGDGKLHMLYYNIEDGWQPGQGYIAGFFYQGDISSNGLPILNIDTYPGVYYKNSSGTEYKRMDTTYGTMVHEYQHLINYSNTSGMSTWLNECFSAAAEEICYPGSSLVGRIQSWENYYYSDNGDWLNPPAEFQYQSSNSLHTGYSMYAWSNSLDNTSLLTLYSQVSFFAQYLYSRFGNTIYKQISNKYSSSETSAITSATGVSCADLVRDFRVAVTANATQDQYNGIYGFKVQNGYDPSQYNDVQSPYDLLGPVVFTGTSCSIKGGGAITVKPVNGVYNPPSGASSSLKYIGIKLNPHTVTAISNNNAWGTVSVNGSGTVITATPAAGYYAAGYEVISGTAAVTQNGNVFTVSATEDCTIRINFAAKEQITVTYVANGSVMSTATAYTGDAITLPATAPAFDGWTFAGWIAQQLDETAEKPAYYEPGASYTAAGNTTLYALYTRLEEGTGETSYKLIESAPADWSGNYVITYGSNNSLVAFKSVPSITATTAIESAANASTLSASGMTLADGMLTNVAASYVFAVEPKGNSYTIRSKDQGYYVGMDNASTNAISAYPTYTASYCDWTIGAISSVHSAQVAASVTYPYLSYSTQNSYFWSGSANGSANASVNWWKEQVNGTYYYSTNPVNAAHEHTMEYVAAAAPTCTVAGNTAYYHCTTCNKYFSDANGENEITLASTVIAALGHNYVDVVTAPTETTQGYTTHTCSRCGDTYVDSYTDPLGSDFTVHFSVPTGVTAP
ncbi:MAG: InlB B-repeat-containing protein, partial [Candidatus Faecousia sp.]|nr:InlB B-repeat-containing protein [Candidatus Faecousia sp.]